MLLSKTMLGVYFTSNQQDSTSISRSKVNLDEFYVNETTDLMIMPLLPNYSSSLPPSDIYNTDPEESFAISLSF